MINNCDTCKYANWNCDEYYYGITYKQWSFAGCDKDMDENADNCPGYVYWEEDDE